MERKDALTLLNIYKTEKELNRSLYPEDLVNRRYLAKHTAKTALAEYHANNWLLEDNLQGANVYKLSHAGLDAICAYRDIRNEVNLLNRRAI